MKCYYEELGIPRDASDADIKTAYRKLALRWHPDKNMDNLEEAKEKFQSLQQAYEVLSDHHERAWYDNHREQILRGKNSEYEENCLDLFAYFTVSCFKGYGDDEKGFYKTYAEVFEKIAAEDAEFMEDEEEIENIPKFGDSTSSYDEVVGPFYAYWQSYCTKKTYTWLCPHDITQIKDRRGLRYIEKNMKKIVQAAKKERNEEVRNLVSFIRKRDRRVQAYKKVLEEKAALNRQKQEQNRLEQIRKRNRELEEMRANANIFNEGFEQQLKQLEQEYDGGVDSSDDESDLSGEEEQADFVDELYCVACNRAFSNKNAFNNHETSKKHKDNIEKLVREMQEEQRSHNDDGTPRKKVQVVEIEDLEDCDFYDMSDDEDVNCIPSDLDNLEDDDLLDSELYDELNDLIVEEDDDADDLDLDKDENKAEEVKDEKVKKEEEQITSLKKKSKSKKNKKTNKTPKVENKETTDEEANEVIDGKIDEKESDDDWATGKKTAKKSRNKKSQKKSTPAESSKPQNESVVKEPMSEESAKSDDTPSTATIHSCVTCQATFPSKNKLFAHLKKTNHGVYIPKDKPKTVETQTAKKAKGKRK